MGIRDMVVNWLFPAGNDEFEERKSKLIRYRNYRRGKQSRQLKVKEGQFDDNLVVNFSGLVVDRSVSMLFGRGVEFDLGGDGTTAEEQYLEEVWNTAKQEILLHRIAMLGAEAGTCFIKIIPDGAVSPKTGKNIPRLIVLDPSWVLVEAEPEDFEVVRMYTIRYNIVENGKTVARKQEIENIEGRWEIRDYRADDRSGGHWILMADPQPWEYDFPPVLHWQNLPSPDSIEGVPDITDDVIALQDRFNFIASNISKIIRYYAHPTTWGRGIGTGPLEGGPGKLIRLDGSDSMLANLEMASDLSSSQSFALMLRQSLFDITRTVDLDSLSDKLGSLTNFGLRVIYQDAMFKLATKRELYGDALIELNRRLLVIGGYNRDGGEIIWPDVLPVNQQEESSGLQADLNMGIVSKETASQKRGYDWEDEQTRMTEEAQAGGNVGAMLLQSFNRGQ